MAVHNNMHFCHRYLVFYLVLWRFLVAGPEFWNSLPQLFWLCFKRSSHGGFCKNKLYMMDSNWRLAGGRCYKTAKMNSLYLIHIHLWKEISVIFRTLTIKAYFDLVCTGRPNWPASFLLLVGIHVVLSNTLLDYHCCTIYWITNLKNKTSR